jgi:iron complex outermembrane receptor protein
MAETRGITMLINKNLALLCVSAVAAFTGMTQATRADVAATASDSSSSSAELETIIVTAQKRSEDLQKTPISVTAVAGTQLASQHVEDIADLGSIIPNLQIIPISETVQINVRGIGSNFFDPRAQSSLAQSIDGLYYARPPQAGGTFFDVSRIEVLRGPQGTLYGTNSAGGAVNLVTNQPSDHLEAFIEAGVGNHAEKEYEVMLNVPVTDDLAVRIAGKGYFHSGYVADFYDDADDNAVRISSKWTPSERLTVFFSYNYSAFGGHGTGATSYPCDPVPYSNVISARCAPPGNPGGAYALTGKVDGNLQTGQLNLTYDMGFATLTSITGHLSQVIMESALPNGTFFIQHLDQKSRDWSEELRLAGNDDARHAGGFGWVAGGYFSTGNGNQYYTALGLPVILPELPERTYAGFAQTTYGVSDTIRVTGGVRYTHDYKGVKDVYGTDLKVTSNHFNYRAEAETDVTEHSLLYVSASTGYVAGGGNGGFEGRPAEPGIIPSTFAPETITSFEIGSKNTLLNGALRLNGDFFHYRVKNFQSYDPGFLNNGIGPALQIQDIGDATIYGGEFDGELALTAQDRITLDLSLSHGTFGPITLDSFAPGPMGLAPVQENVPSGYPVTNLPKWDLRAGYSHRWDLSNSGKVEGAISEHVSGSYWTVPASNDTFDQQKSFAMTDANLRYTSPLGWSVLAYVKNLENRATTTYGENPGFHLYFPAPPRTFGLTASYRYR